MKLKHLVQSTYFTMYIAILIFSLILNTTVIVLCTYQQPFAGKILKKGMGCVNNLSTVATKSVGQTHGFLAALCRERASTMALGWEE